jgi:hypothetical protein
MGGPPAPYLSTIGTSTGIILNTKEQALIAESFLAFSNCTIYGNITLTDDLTVFIQGSTYNQSKLNFYLEDQTLLVERYSALDVNISGYGEIDEKITSADVTVNNVTVPVDSLHFTLVPLHITMGLRILHGILPSKSLRSLQLKERGSM